MADVLAERRAERDRLLALARDYVGRLSERIDVRAAAVVGSVARGDFNVWSDVDVLVVAAGLPERTPDRMALLLADASGGVQPVGYTPVELDAAARRGNPVVREAVADGIVITGGELLRRAVARHLPRG